jgi:hypothetical protein
LNTYILGTHEGRGWFVTLPSLTFGETLVNTGP